MQKPAYVKKANIRSSSNEKIIAEVATLFASEKDLSRSVSKAIDIVGNDLNLDCIYIFKDNQNGSVPQIRYHWSSPKIDTKPFLSSIEKSQLIDIKNQLKEQRLIIANEVSELQTDSLEILSHMGIKSLFIAPIIWQENPIGFIILASLINKKEWQDTEIDLMNVLCKMMGKAFESVEYEKLLRSREKLFKNITDSISDLMTHTNTDGKITYASQSWFQRIGFTIDEVIGKYLFNFVHPDDLPQVLREFDALKQHNSGIIRFRLVNKTGNYYWSETRCAEIQDDKGKHVGYVFGSYFIDKRVKAEQRLIDSEEKYRLLFEKAPIGVMLVDDVGNVIEANQEIIKILSFKKEELINSNVFYSSWLQQTTIFTDFKTCLQQKRPISGEKQFLSSKNEYLTFKYYLNPIVEGNDVHKIQAVMVDITEQKKIELELKNNQDKLKQITDNITDVITEIDNNGIISYASPSWKQVLGYNPLEVIGQNVLQYLDDEAQRFFKNRYLRKQSADISAPLIHSFKNKNGQYIWLESRGQFIMDENNQVIGTLFGSSDCTERKQAEEKLLLQNNALKKANEELDKFVYRASHDLKSPLSSVLGLINISQYVESLPERNEYLGLMQNSITKLDNTIKQITTYSRNSRLELQSEKIDFKALCDQLFSELSYLDNKHLIAENVIIEEHDSFYSDKSRLEIIFKNLITNAYNYHRISHDKPYILVNILVKDRELLLNVEDNGEGIIEEEQDKVFEMFHRSSSHSKGSGLGLYIVKETLLKLNGEISLTSKVNKGTNFTVKIPSFHSDQSTSQ